MSPLSFKLEIFTKTKKIAYATICSCYLFPKQHLLLPMFPVTDCCLRDLVFIWSLVHTVNISHQLQNCNSVSTSSTKDHDQQKFYPNYLNVNVQIRGEESIHTSREARQQNMVVFLKLLRSIVFVLSLFCFTQRKVDHCSPRQL